MQHAGHPDVVDVAAVAERQCSCFVLGATGADATGQHGIHLGALGDGFDRVEHLHVPRAAAQVRAEVAGHVSALQVGALLVHLCLRPHHDARDAEAALQATACGERIRVARAFRLVDAFQRGDGAPGDLLHRVGARDLHLAVDHHRAAAALALWRATVLRRGDVELLAERGEQVWMFGSHRDRGAVEDELDSHALHFVKVGSGKRTRANVHRVNAVRDQPPINSESSVTSAAAGMAIGSIVPIAVYTMSAFRACPATAMSKVTRRSCDSLVTHTS